jgi:RHS repeat-associated protein
MVVRLPGAVPPRSGEPSVTAITSATAEVESRQSFDPWGSQLSGPSLEMGYLGAWERPSDPVGGLIQMGARSYDPALGSFVSEDPVLGHFGVAVSANRYPYAWDNPLNRYDLEGRDVEIPGAPICVLGCSPEEPRELTDRAQDFWKHVRGPLSDIYNFAGNHWQGCVEGAGAGAATGATLGAPAGPPGSAAGARTGALVGCFDTVQAEILLEIASS